MLLLVSTALAVPPAKAVKDTLREIRQTRPECVVTQGDNVLAYTIACPDEPALTLYMDRLVAMCARSREECTGYRSNLITGLLTHEHATPLSLDRVVPAMRTHAYVEEAEASFAPGATSATLLATPYGHTLDMLWMFDLPTSMRPLVAADLATLNVDRAALEAAARDNCTRIFQVTDRMDQGDFHLVAGAEYTACALFLDADALAGASVPVTWATMPTASIVLFSTSTAPGAALELQGLSAKIAAASAPGDRVLDATVLRRTPTGWEAISP